MKSKAERKFLREVKRRNLQVIWVENRILVFGPAATRPFNIPEFDIIKDPAASDEEFMVMAYNTIAGYRFPRRQMSATEKSFRKYLSRR